MKYMVSIPEFGRGDICQLSLADTNSEDLRLRHVIIKKAIDPADNDLLVQEANSLKALRVLPKPWIYSLPILDSSLRLPNEENRQANILSMESGFFTCEHIKQMVPDGLDGRTLGWMWRRVLGLLEWVHGKGLVHGAITPAHVMFFPDNTKRGLKDPRRHGIRIIDWCYSVEVGARQLSAWCPKWREFYPEEVLAKTTEINGWVDIYMGAKLMLYLAGPKIDSLPDEMSAHFAQCLGKGLGDSRQLATERLNSFTALLKRVYGEPKFHNFVIPGI